MKIAVAQINPIIGDVKGNKKKILDSYFDGVKQGADLVVCPELSLLGYPPLDMVEKKEFRKAVQIAAEEIASETKDAGLIFGSIHETDDDIGTNLYNSAFLCYSGEIKFIQHKTLIPNYDVFDEMRYFECSKDAEIHKFKDQILGISICEDIWNDKDYWKKRLYQNDPVELQVKKGATLLINISASPYSYGKRLARKEMLSTLARQDKVKLIYACNVGAQSELIFDGASMCFDEYGNLLMLGKLYETDLFIYDTEKIYSPIIKLENSFEEEIIDALTLGIKDYCNKLGFKKALIGLSGGIDSALVTYIAVRALGKENVHVLLLPSKYSSEGSVKDSLKLIANLGISHEEISIQSVVDATLESLSKSFNGKPEDRTEENIQSRVRGQILMAISNKFGYLVLTTGNKSELATGYATLYGDMCGGLAVIADVYKTDVYRLSNYINRKKEIIPREIIQKAPSAELKPNQTDQDTLPPYEVLDKILRMYLEENKEEQEISDIVKANETISKVLLMVDQSEYKRKQAAPALRVSNKAFGYGRRYPIVQGWRK